MCHREEAQQGLLSADDISLDAEGEVPSEVITREHDPLAEARRTGDVLIEEQVGSQTVVVVEGDADTIEEAEVKTEVERLVLFPREVG